jgi:c-di-AMP phosphodiesterase-like protein
MLLDFWANYYAQMKASGKEQLFENDDFDLDVKRIMDELEAQDDGWEPVEDWSLDKQGLLDD